jgi:hypothetical protein
VLYLRGGVWWTKFKHNGETVRLSTEVRKGKGSKKKAAAAARRKRVEHEEKAPVGSSGLTLEDLCELHVEWLEDKGRGDQRVETVENLWRNLYRHLGGKDRDPTTLTIPEIQGYEGKRRSEKPPHKSAKGQTIRREVQALIHKGLMLAKRAGIIDGLPFDPDDLDPIENDAPKHEQTSKARSDKEINKVLLALSKKAKRAGYLRMLRFIRETGLRLEEFRRYDDTWLHPTFLRVPTLATKTGRVTQVGRDLPLSKEGRATCRELGHTFKRKKFNHALEIACRRASVSPVLTPRDLRGTAITEWARKDPAAAQYLAGHTSLATTAKYVKIGRDAALKVGQKAIRGAQGGGHSARGRRRKAQ